MLENTCNVSKHNTKNSYQTIFITFPRFCFGHQNPKSKRKMDDSDESMEERREDHGQSGEWLDRQQRSQQVDMRSKGAAAVQKSQTSPMTR